MDKMEPTKKAKPIEDFLESTYKRSTSIRTEHCIPTPIGCGKPIGIFRDEMSKREYRISGFCQNCQDEIFGKKPSWK